MEPTKDQKEEMAKALRSIGVSKSALEEAADEISELVAPGESLWEYPGQLYLMVKARIEAYENSIQVYQNQLAQHKADADLFRAASYENAKRAEIAEAALTKIHAKCLDAFAYSDLANDSKASHDLFKELWDIAERVLMKHRQA